MMEIRTETVVIGNEEFEIRELTVAEMLPAFRADDGDGFGTQLALMRAAVCQNGAPLGDALDNLPGRVFGILAPVVTRLNGLAEESEGNE